LVYRKKEMLPFIEEKSSMGEKGKGM